MVVSKKRKKSVISKKGDILFYWGLLILPLIQIAIFYFAVNINSFLMAFQKFDLSTKSYYMVGFDNFKKIFVEMGRVNTMIYAIENSVVYYLLGFLTSLPLGLIFSYYVYKNAVGGAFFKVMLFLPTIIPPMATTLLMYNFGREVLPLLGLVELSVSAGRWNIFFTIYFMIVMLSFGTNIIMYSGAMSGIDQSLVEAAEIDGASPMQEFTKITIPMIWPTLATFVTVGVAGIFSQQMYLFGLFPDGAPSENYTIGYYLFVENNKLSSNALFGNQTGFPKIAAIGLLFTAFAVPMVYGMKFLLKKIGPSID